MKTENYRPEKTSTARRNMRGSLPVFVGFLLLSLLPALGAASDNLITNGGFESGLSGWRPAWSRQPGAIKVSIDSRAAHGGTASAKIEHQGTNDWSFETQVRIPVQPGDIVEMQAWLRFQGPGSVTLCASTWDAQGKAVDWSYGERTVRAVGDWSRLYTRFLIPPGVSQVQPRLIGTEPATLWVDDFTASRRASAVGVGASSLPATMGLTNGVLEVRFDPTNATLLVLDRRTGRQWRQNALRPNVIVTGGKATGRALELDLLEAQSGLDLKARLEIDPLKPEFTFSLAAHGELVGAMRFPHPFASAPGDYLVVPMNEGISYPVEDSSIEPFRLIAYGGHGICMAFWGVTDGQQGYSAVIETPDDAAIRLERIQGRLVIAPEWDPQKGQFGYERCLRYVFFDRGGHVAIAKRYREHARQNGLLKTLEEKRRENPNVDRLIGAVNVWNWESDPVALARELQAAGIDRILWSRGGSPEALRALNEINVLTSRYDIYQDVMDPANFPQLRWLHPDWTTAAWPNDIILRADGDWLRGWGVKGKEDQWFHCGVICDRRALDYARPRLSAELATHPYLCRFIDTTTAAPWNECYNTNHPMTRTESRVWKMKLLDCISREFKLVTGCETGHDASVPFLHYFEGMLSLGPYRVPDAGRDMQRIWNDPPERVVKFQLGHAYRLPLWELVFHDCVVAQWYWGDYNNKLPSLWDKRDLFNLLYGTPPMFMFNRSLWQSQRDRFVQSYKNTCPYVRATGYAEMTDHRFLTPDRAVQQTTFANGVNIIVNFGAAPHRLPSGEVIGALGFQVTGMPNATK
jgi:hypothetical protein